MQFKHVWTKHPYMDNKYELQTFLDCGLVHCASISKNTNGDWHVYSDTGLATYRVTVKGNELRRAKLIAQQITEV